uniref:X-ray radiation resistance associated 1 n=1 Tax=Nothobranchius rachovii TaxID=451742 RepID=A0A1A8R106_9TELE
MLDNNRLSSEVFYSLTNLKRLKTLNLQGNRISEIPQLQLRDVSKPGQLPAAEREDEAHTESRTDIHERLKTLKTFHTSSWEKDLKGFSLPLPELQHLNLADNKITAEEALIGAAFFLKLSELRTLAFLDLLSPKETWNNNKGKENTGSGEDPPKGVHGFQTEGEETHPKGDKKSIFERRRLSEKNSGID